ncbi:MAG: GGDEF domain-containing protein [Lachnospiraceae bacterium]|nr:GGDEF domain-containing protein [Lachnospiraceae bacterium]
MGELYNIEDDKRFIEKVDRITSEKSEILSYHIGLSSCLIVHTLYLILFYTNGYKEMAIFNIFSVLFYLLTVISVRFIKKRIKLVIYTLIEIIIHASAATFFVGWAPDFGMFLLMIIPILFLMPSSHRSLPFVMMIISLFLYGILRFLYDEPESTKYNLYGTKEGNTFYIINIIVGIFVLVYTTAIYTINNMYTECKLRIQTEQLRIMASIDTLTRLNNRRSMNDYLKDMKAKSKASGKNYVLGIGDIDNFKRVNDTYGHEMGDEVLIAVAATLKEKAPKSACVARWGGEEFLIAIPNSNLDEGVKYAENLIKAIEQIRFKHEDKEFNVTLTLGICEGHPKDVIDNVISTADNRLYKGKKAGKNRVEYTD